MAEEIAAEKYNLLVLARSSALKLRGTAPGKVLYSVIARGAVPDTTGGIAEDKLYAAGSAKACASLLLPEASPPLQLSLLVSQSSEGSCVRGSGGRLRRVSRWQLRECVSEYSSRSASRMYNTVKKISTVV
eukprot:IDg1874t1